MKKCSGEKLVQDKLDLLPKDKYRVFNNVVLYKSDGHTTEIDSIVVSLYGIFVIETKDIQGVVKGSLKSKYWRVLKLSSRMYNKSSCLFSPLIQNNIHIKAINDILGLERNVYRNIVCFTSDKVAVNVKGFRVITIENLFDKIRGYTNEVLTYEEVDSICERIHNKELKTQNKIRIHKNDFNGVKNMYMQKQGVEV